MSQRLSCDAEAMKSSYFVALAQDAQAIKRWEESEGLIKFFQGHLTTAIDLLYEETQSHEAQGSSDPTLKIAHVRALIEMAETYHHLIELESYLLPQWLSYERGRPNATAQLDWYRWVELAALSAQTRAGHAEADAKRVERITQLMTELGARPEMNAWRSFASDLMAEVPRQPKRPKASYQRWVKFARAVHRGELEDARTLFKKLKLGKPLFKIVAKSEKGGTQTTLKIYDPRVAQSLKSYYLQWGLLACQSVELEGYYCGRLYELRGDHKSAVDAYQRGQKQATQLINEPRSRHRTDHLVLSIHTEISGIQVELSARLKRLGVNVQPQTSTQAQLGLPKTLPSSEIAAKDHSKPSQPEQKKSVSTQVTSTQEYWRRFQDPEQLSTPHLVPDRRAALSLLASAALEASQGPAINEVAMFGLVDRWLDELHYRYAQLLIHQDDRVSAMKALNTAEEVKFGARLGGRNRLTRLLLSAYNYLKMNQQRVTVKYLRRLQRDLPALSFALGMTSDVLSGKSFEQKEGNVTSGQ